MGAAEAAKAFSDITSCVPLIPTAPIDAQPVAMTDPARTPNSRALRRGRYSIAGQVYLLTTTTYRRRPLFADWHIASRVCAVLHEDRLWRDSRLLCWVLMPDHVHLLVSLGQAEPLPKLMQRVKSVISKAVNCAASTTGQRTWMPAYHDRAMRRGEDMLAMARYVVMNPLRAGLVRRIGAYPYWNAVWF